MDVVTGMDASTSVRGVDGLLAGIRRLTALADEASGRGAIFQALACELIAASGAQEVHVHHLAARDGDDLVEIYLFDGGARISHVTPRSERPAGISWVAGTGRRFLAAQADELEASVPRLAASGDVGSALLLPLAERGKTEAVVVLVARGAEPLDTAVLALAGALVEQAGTALALVKARAEAGTDAVTGCMNHRAMRRRLDEEIGRARRTGGPLSCLLIDLDDFKQVNDEHGHPAGDALLRGVVQALVGEFRAFDRVARYGGDEFVVILPNAGLESAAAAASRALERLRQIGVAGRGVSASIGVAEWQEGMGTDELLNACDAALLRAKRQGKGRVTRSLDGAP